jgi:hypothetical protein
MVHFCAACGGCTQTDIVREHLKDTLRICDVSAMGLYTKCERKQTTNKKLEMSIIFYSPVNKSIAHHSERLPGRSSD